MHAQRFRRSLSETASQNTDAETIRSAFQAKQISKNRAEPFLFPCLLPFEKMKLIFATKNSGKTKELSKALEETEFKVESLIDQKIEAAPETGSSFLENALIKCKSVSETTGRPTIADDSGLVVPALNGRPGIYSARYSGPGASDEENVQKLIQEIGSISDRRAYFFCCLVFMISSDDPFPIFAQGLWRGEILDTPAGSGGFGYDPVFYVPAYGMTAAQLPIELKSSISHRALAINDFLSIYLKNEENLR